MAKSEADVVGPIMVGKSVLVRAVTHYYTGRVVAFSAEELLLEDAAWIADTGRFATALRTGVLSEVEPYPDGVVSINRGAIVDVSEWKHALPRDQK
jgi:hypothetical protein